MKKSRDSRSCPGEIDWTETKQNTIFVPLKRKQSQAIWATSSMQNYFYQKCNSMGQRSGAPRKGDTVRGQHPLPATSSQPKRQTDSCCQVSRNQGGSPDSRLLRWQSLPAWEPGMRCHSLCHLGSTGRYAIISS